MRARSIPRSALGAVVAVLVLVSAAGCSDSASTTTCDQFAAKSQSDQDGVLRRLLDSHDKASGVFDGAGNLVQLRGEVELFCGIYSITGSKAATKNQDQPITNAANWS